MLASWATSRADIMWFHLLQLERCPVQYDQFKRAPTLVTAQRGKDGPGIKPLNTYPTTMSRPSVSSLDFEEYLRNNAHLIYRRAASGGARAS